MRDFVSTGISHRIKDHYSNRLKHFFFLIDLCTAHLSVVCSIPLFDKGWIADGQQMGVLLCLVTWFKFWTRQELSGIVSLSSQLVGSGSVFGISAVDAELNRLWVFVSSYWILTNNKGGAPSESVRVLKEETVLYISLCAGSLGQQSQFFLKIGDA